MEHPLKSSRPDRANTEELDSVVEWRRERMRKAGFTPTQSLALAISTADIHRAEHLLEAGCPKRLVVAILI